MKKYVLYIIFLAQYAAISAQQMPWFNQYTYNSYIYNPARAGAESLGNVYLMHQRLWSNMPMGGDAQRLTFEMPLKGQKSGIGAVFHTDRTHILRRMGATFSYAYHVQLNDEGDHQLGMGLSLGFLNQSIDYSKATSDLTNDPATATYDVNRTIFDMGAGLYYRYKNFKMDFSIPQLSLGSRVNYINTFGDRTAFNMVNHFMISARYKAYISKKDGISLEPVLIAKVVTGYRTELNGNLILDWKDRLWAGGGYRYLNTGGNLNFSSGVRISNTVSFSYVYELPVNNSVWQNLGATHEFMLGIRFGHRLKRLQEQYADLKETVEKSERALGDTTKAMRKELSATNKTAVDAKSQSQAAADKVERIDKSVNRKVDSLSKNLELNNQKVEILTDRVNDMKGQNHLFINRVKLGSVYFMYNSPYLTDEAKVQLMNIKQIIDSKGIRVRIDLVGNASTEGTSTDNQLLGNRRSLAAKEYLVSIGVNPEWIVAVSQGEENPASTEAIYQDKIANRRVDVFIVTE